MNLSRARWPGALAGVALLAAACGGDDLGPSAPFFSVPWDGEESHTYNLSERGVPTYGTCTLETRPEGETTTLLRLCSDEGADDYDPAAPNRDDGEARVDSATLRPEFALRTIDNADRGTLTTFASTYGEDEVQFEADVNGEGNRATRDLPQPTEDEPNPVYYDDETLLWLVRGIPFAEGWTGVYHNVAASTGRVFQVQFEVERIERIEVPAGTFETWRVRVQSSGGATRIWVEIEAPHRVVRAQIDRLTYELK